MDPTLISADAQDPRKDKAFHAREFRRLVVLTWAYKRALVTGLVCTVLFALTHTASLGGVFPVFVILLEDEGLQQRADRTLAGERLGATLVRGTSETFVRVGRVSEALPGDTGGVKLDDALHDPEGRPIEDLLHDLANAPSGQTVTVVAVDAGGERRTLQITPDDLDFHSAVLRWGASLIPADANTAQGKLRLLGTILGMLIVIVIAANVFRYFGEVLIATAILRTMMALRAQLYERTLQLPMSYFSGQPTADLVSRFVQDVQEIQRGLITLFGKFIREPLRALCIFGVALWIDWRITLTMVIVAPVAALTFMLVGRSVKKANRKLLQAYGLMIDALTTSLQNLRVVKAYTAEHQERDRLYQVDRKVLRQQLKLTKLQAFISPMMETLAVIAGSILTVWLASCVLSDELGPSEFVTLGFVLGMLFDPLRKLTDVYVRVQRSTAGAERIFQVIDHPIESDLTTGKVDLKPLATSIELSGVSFTYPGAIAPALTDIDLTIHRGETIAIVGPNGCGKTTLVSMLPRLFIPDAGTIRYDGVDLSDATLRSLRLHIGLVSQEAIVFAGTPRDNIAYGLESHGPSQIEKASRRAFADEFIRQIPGAYDANLGERGTTLSGGQRQRLAIARAIFRDAPILIFDEATSQVDTESELKIQNALRELSKDRTTLIVAHRLSTIQFARRIVVMEGGRIVDTGTHDELLTRCRLYKTLCETQFGGTGQNK